MIYKLNMQMDAVNLQIAVRILLWCLDVLEGVHITDIRKLYKNGVSDSVLETYGKYIRR